MGNVTNKYRIMGICELLEGLVPPNTEIVTSPQFLSTRQNKNQVMDKEKSTDVGQFAVGRPDPEDPHAYDLKTINAGLKHKDPKLTYFSAIEHIKGDNPWLPVVYKTTVVRDPEDYDFQQPQYKMQKYFNYTELPSALVRVTIKSILKDKPLTMAMQRKYDEVEFNQRKNMGSDQERTDGYMKLLTQLIIAAVKGHVQIKDDPQLAQAAELIRDVVNSHPEFFLDLHFDNIMFRPGAKGTLHPVITDPVAI